MTSGMATIIADTATVDPRARLADGVLIGPRCVIGPDVRIGPGTVLVADCVVLGRATLGSNNVIHRHVRLDGFTRHRPTGDTRLHLEIGDDNILGEHTHVRIGEDPRQVVTRIGHRNLIQRHALIGPACCLADEIQVGDNVHLGDGTRVGSHAVLDAEVHTRAGVEIGVFSVVGRRSRVEDHVPSFVVAKGSPAAVAGLNEVGLQRLGCTEADIAAIRTDFSKYIERTSSREEWTSILEVQLRLPLQVHERLSRLRTRSDKGHPPYPEHGASRHARRSISLIFGAKRNRRI